MIDKIINKIVAFFDILDKIWHKTKTEKTLGSIIVITYLIDLLLIFFNRHGLFSKSISLYIHGNYFDAIGVAFNLLLFFEVISLIVTLPKSFSDSLVKQFEILSIILLRHAFDEIKNIESVINWDTIIQNIYHMGSNAMGALIIFGGILLIKKMQKHRDVTRNKRNKLRFIRIKKTIALSLILIFAYFFINDSILLFSKEITFNFFKRFYSVLILADILMVLISLRYSQSYIVLFRNSGFALATVLLRIALSAPNYINIALGILSIIFTIAIIFIYSNYKIEALKKD